MERLRCNSQTLTVLHEEVTAPWNMRGEKSLSEQIYSILYIDRNNQPWIDANNLIQWNLTSQKEHSVSHQCIKTSRYTKDVEDDCYVYTSQSHQCNSRNISEYDWSKGCHDSILVNRKFTHRKQWNIRHSTKQFHVTRPVCVSCEPDFVTERRPKINEVSKRKEPNNPNNTNNWEQF